MKELVTYEQALGETGSLKGALGVEGDHLEIEMSGSYKYPLAKIIEPAAKVFDNVMDALEKAIPGDWDKKYAVQAKEQFREQLLKIFSEQVPQLAAQPAE